MRASGYFVLSKMRVSGLGTVLARIYRWKEE
jgi:hypothetical protein